MSELGSASLERTETRWNGALAVCAALLAVACSARAGVLPAGTKLEVRLSTATGSRSSRPGDPVKATVIAPILDDDHHALLEGAIVFGVVKKVQTLGLGLKQPNAEVAIRFDSLQLPDGTSLPVNGQVREIETARERVDTQGTIQGIHPAANLSSGISFAISTLLLNSDLLMPAIALKLLAVRSPDSEIYLPAGTELFVELTRDVFIPPSSRTAEETPGLLPAEMDQVENLLRSLPTQQTVVGGTHSSDLINVLLLGSSDQINTAFRAAGWTGECRHSALALYRMYHGLVQRTGYSMAPMSRLRFNGMLPGKAYQKSLDTLTRRHHLRLWKQPNSNAWLGAASEDVGLTIRRMHITHAIDLGIDNERAKVVNDLWFTGCVAAASLVARDTLKPVLEGGSPVATDGDIAVLRMKNCNHPRTVPKSTPPAHRSRAFQMIQAIGVDLARANPVTVAYVAIRSAAGWPKPKIPPAESLQAEGWQRPSVIDARPDENRVLKVARLTGGQGTPPLQRPESSAP